MKVNLWKICSEQLPDESQQVFVLTTYRAFRIVRFGYAFDDLQKEYPLFRQGAEYFAFGPKDILRWRPMTKELEEEIL